MRAKAKSDEHRLDYRPASYWSSGNPLINVKGAHRKRVLEEALEAGELDEVPPEILEENLPGEMLSAAGKFDPRLMGGEYLPDCDEEEVEIARICLESTLADVISVRACPGGEGIVYRVADEYETEFEIHPETSGEPLTTRELIELIDNAQHPDLGPGLTSSYRDFNHDCSGGMSDPEELRHFVTVESDFYPALPGWYEAEAEVWVRSKKSRK